MNRRKFLTALSAGAALSAAYPFSIEPQWLDASTYRLSLSSPLKAPLRIAHLSDFHVSPSVSWNLLSWAMDTTVSREPDIICLTGDFITNELIEDNRLTKLLLRLSEAAPTFAVLGNHDGGSWCELAGGYKDTAVVRRVLQDAGIVLLHNEATLFMKGEIKVWFAGVGDLWSGEVDGSTAFRAVPENSEMPVILLAHNPDSKELLAGYRWDLMLAGHTHGGQLVIPFTGATPFAPVKDKRYVSGIKPWEGRLIAVSRGVGCLHSARFNCRPEAALIEIAAAEAA